MGDLRVDEKAHKLIGATIGGRYQVLSLIGEGSMGTVFLCEHTVIRKRMALKLLNDDSMKDPKAVARFEREAMAAAHIDHPNVAAATDSGRTEDGTLFVAFEYVDGQSLRRRLGKGPLPPTLALHIIKQMVGALVRAHSLGIVHRHLKPENIMLMSRDGVDDIVKVLDFGLAKVAAGQLGATSEVLTSYGTVLGTPEYMAPEQAAGGEIDARTDLYAVGVMSYEMLTGILPFVGDKAELLRQHMAAPAPTFKARAPEVNVPSALEAMTIKLLEKNPETRFESAKALLDAIEAQTKTDSAAEKSASENETMVAPPDLPARLFGELPPEEQTNSLKLAIDKLKTAATSSPAPSPSGLSQKIAQVRDKVAARYAQLLAFVRDRLPQKHRGIAQRTLGLGVGAVLILPLLILILILAFSGDDSSQAGNAMPGFASEREMEKAVSGDVRDLAKLAAKYPNDSRVFRAMARANVARKDYAGALRAVSTLARLDPTMASDDEMIQIITSAALLPETSDTAITVLESQLGDKGIGVLSDLAERTTTEPLKGKLTASLQKGTTRALASEPTLILVELRAAQRCEDKRTLLKRAGQQGDARTLSYLQAVQQTTTGCGANGQGDCWTCLHRGSALKATMDAIGKRLGG